MYILNEFKIQQFILLYLYVALILEYQFVFMKIFEGSEIGKLYDDGQLIKIKDYHNLSISISTSKNIYLGFPPSLKSTCNRDLIVESNGVTINNNFVLFVCLRNFHIGKLNINTGELTRFSYLQGTFTYKKNCAATAYKNLFYSIVIQNSGDKIAFDRHILTMSDINNEIKGPSADIDSTYGKFKEVDYISYQQQIECDYILISDDNDFRFVCVYVKPETLNNSIIYNIYGFIGEKEDDEYLIFSSNLETDIEMYKIDDYTLRCKIKGKQKDIKLEKINSTVNIINNTEYPIDDELILWDKSLFFYGLNNSISLKNNKYSNYYYFLSPSIITKFLFVQYSFNNMLIFYYQTIDSFYYLTLRNYSYYFDIKGKTLNFSNQCDTNLLIDLNQLEKFENEDEEGNFQLSHINYNGKNTSINYYYNESNQTLLIYKNQINQEMILEIAFDYILVNKTDFQKEFYFHNYITYFIEFKICQTNIDNNLPYVIDENEEYVIFCPFAQLLDKTCKINNIFNNYLGNITNNVENIIYNYSLFDNSHINIIGNKIIYQIISSKYKSINNNISYIDLGEIEDLLKIYNKINYFFILKFDIRINETIPIKTEYKMYNPISKKILNLSIFKNKNINIKSPLILNYNSLNLFKYSEKFRFNIFNRDEPFFHDICYTFTSDYGTDMILSDRRKVYYREDKMFCEEGCQFVNYNMDNMIVECKCSIKTNVINKIEIIDFDFKRDDLSSFFNVKTYANIACMKCYKLLFSKNGFIGNYGNYLLLIIIIIYIIIMILFYLKYEINILSLIPNYINTIKTIKQKTKFNNFICINRSINRNNEDSENKSPISEIKNLTLKKSNLKLSEEIISINLLLKNNKKKTEANSFDQKFNNLKTNNESSKENFYYDKLNDEEINSLDYTKACILDKRGLFKYYWSLIKAKNVLLFTFFSKNDYNLIHLKICLFLVSFSLFLAVNGLFFTDHSMNKIYKDKGIFNFIFQLPKIIYSTLITTIINIIMKKLSLSQSNIISLKNTIFHNKNIDKEKEIHKLIKALKIKFNLFYMIGFFLLCLFWYYIGVFCATYKNTQIVLLKNSITSYAINLIYPFLLSFLPAFLRIPSLKYKNEKILYKLSLILSII